MNSTLLIACVDMNTGSNTSNSETDYGVDWAKYGVTKEAVLEVWESHGYTNPEDIKELCRDFVEKVEYALERQAGSQSPDARH